MSDLARRTPGSIRLETGDPNFMTPQHITEGALRRASSTRTGYPPTAGIPELRAAIADKLGSKNEIRCAPENVVVTVGATGALTLSFLATLDPGDEVLVPDPGWAGYPAMVALSGATLKTYDLDPATGFALDASVVEASLSARTRAIVLNTPNNPTGAVYERSELDAVKSLARDAGIWIISDECYEDIVFDREHHSLAADEDLDASGLVSVFSCSKTYAMTGWRIGYLVTGAEIARSIVRLQSPSVASASIISQWAALEALTGPQDSVAAMAEEYQSRRDLVVGMLADASVPFIAPSGAFYVLIDVRQTGTTSTAFASSLLKDVGVCTTPGSAFGTQSEGFVRISLACDPADLREGVSRLTGYLSDFPAVEAPS